VLLPTLGRPTIATNGNCAAPARAGTTDLRYVGKKASWQTRRAAHCCLHRFSLTVRLMPNSLYGVSVKDIVATYDMHIEIERLGNEQPVKGILVMRRQRTAPDHLPDRRFKNPESACGHLGLEIIEEMQSVLQFSVAGLDCNLPWDYDRDEQLRSGIGENRPCAVGDFTRRSNRPQECMRVQEKLHFSPAGF
jgi:hypothetical protein